MVGQLVTGNFPKDEMGRPIRPQVVTLVDPTTGSFGSSSQSATYSLASNVASLAAGANTTPVTIPANNSASYGFSYIFGGTSPSLKLQALGADGATWQDVVTVTASGQQGVVIFTGSGGAQLRLYNAGANPITGLTASVAS